jgi:flagellar biosynthetic protein FlhB
MSGERTEKASEQRKKKSQQKGEGVRSRDLTSSTAMLMGLLVLRGAAVQFGRSWSTLYTVALQDGTTVWDIPGSISLPVVKLTLGGLMPLALVVVAALTGALAAGAMQTGGLQLHPAALAWKPSRLSPLSNLKGIFSVRSLLRVAKSLLPAGAVFMLTFHALSRTVLPMPVTSNARLPLTLTVCYSLAVHAAWISLGWSAIDYVNEWRSWSTGLKMSKEDLKQEHKETNGNPSTKGRIRLIQRAMRRRRVRADVSRAAVVITNPTHYAVALLFDLETMATPKVLAKGRDLHAVEIRERARWSGVPIVENPPLARSLFRSVEEGHPIPFELYSAVAAILAFLFREAGERASRPSQQHSERCGDHRPTLPLPRSVLPLEDSPEIPDQAGVQR